MLPRRPPHRAPALYPFHPAISVCEDATRQASCGIIAAVNRKELSRVPSGDGVEQPMSGHWVGLRGRLARPFWGWLGGWAVLCGALASNRLQWDGAALLNLVLVLLLVELAWGSFWDLAVSTARLRPLADGWPPRQPASPATLPYTQPHAPAGRLARWLGRLIGWWRDAFWPAAGPALLGLLAAAILALVLALFLPDRLRPLYGALVALAGLGLIQSRRDRQPLAVEALVRVGLGWLAGHAAFAGVGAASWVLALSFALAAWGNLRVAAGLPRGLWLLNAGQAIGVVALLILKQPLAASLAGLVLFGQVAMQPSLRYGGTPAHITVARRTWPWLMAAMLLAGWALP
jgi:hypothetical protein